MSLLLYLYFLGFVKFNWWKVKLWKNWQICQWTKYWDYESMCTGSTRHEHVIPLLICLSTTTTYSFPMHIVIDWYSPYSHNSHMLLTPRLTILKEGSYITMCWKNSDGAFKNMRDFSVTFSTMKVISPNNIKRDKSLFGCSFYESF